MPQHVAQTSSTRRNSNLKNWPYPFWIAHRGAGKLAPENTMAAFKLGAANGFRAFECDVKLSQDDVPFLLHDSDLERTTNGCGIASHEPWAKLSTLDAGSWHSARFAGEPLLRLRDLAAFCLSGDYALNIEIKPTPGEEEKTGRLVSQEAAQLWRDRPPPLLSSFSDAALAAAGEAEPNLPRALLLDKLSPDWLDRAHQLRCVAVVVHYPLIEPSMLAEIRETEMRVLTYTVNDRRIANELIALGLDGLITDSLKSHEFRPPVSGPSEH